MNYITVEKAFKIIKERGKEKSSIYFPNQISYINHKKKNKKTKILPLEFLLNAITLNKIEHSVLEEIPNQVNYEDIISCYIFGSAINPLKNKIKKRYFFGLYQTEKEEIICPNDIDIMCFTQNVKDIKKIKSLSTWETTIYGGYHCHQEKEYCGFDISFINPSLINSEYQGDKNFIDLIRKTGVCIMGDNILQSRKYAVWSHNVIENTISCSIPRDNNISEEEIKEQKK